METLCIFLIIGGIIALGISMFIPENEITLPLVFIGIVVLLIAIGVVKRISRGRPAPSLNALVTGEKYEVVDFYEKYIIVKSATDNEELKFIGPLDFGTRTTGRYIKTAKESLEKTE